MHTNSTGAYHIPRQRAWLRFYGGLFPARRAGSGGCVAVGSIPHRIEPPADKAHAIIKCRDTGVVSDSLTTPPWVWGAIRGQEEAVAVRYYLG